MQPKPLPADAPGGADAPRLWATPGHAARVILALGRSLRPASQGVSARRVRVALGHAWRRMLDLQIGEALGVLTAIETELAELPAAATASLVAEMDLLRAAGLALQDDTAGALALAGLALRHPGQAEPSARLAATLCRLGHWRGADFAALGRLPRSEPGARLGPIAALTTAIDLSIEAAMELEQLRLGAALRLAHDALALADGCEGQGAGIATLPASIAAQVLHEGGHFADAQRLLVDRMPALAARGTIEAALRAYTVLARISVRSGQLRPGLALLQAAQDLGERRGWVRLCAASLAERVHLLLAAERHEQAVPFMEGLDRLAGCPGPQAPAVEVCRVAARSRLTLAQGPSEAALATLRQLHHQALRRRDLHGALQALLWIIEGLLAHGKPEVAGKLLDRVLELGASLGLCEMLTDAGVRLAGMLPAAYVRASTQGGGRSSLLPYIGCLLARTQNRGTGATVNSSPRPSGPLSPREQEVLQRIAGGLSNKQIALALDIAPETVKSHVKSIFIKLAARTRTEAAVRARERGIV